MTIFDIAELGLGNSRRRLDRIFDDGPGALLRTMVVVQVRVPHPEHDEEHRCRNYDGCQQEFLVHGATHVFVTYPLFGRLSGPTLKEAGRPCDLLEVKSFVFKLYSKI